MDYGDVIVHVFYEEVRLRYDLEGLWADAPRVKTDSEGVEGKKTSKAGPL